MLPSTLRDFHRIHEGEPFLVCGCGSSLSQLTHPERFRTIGVNDVGRLFHPDYLVVLNPRNQFRADRFQYVEQSRAKVIFTQLHLDISHPHVVRFPLGRRGGVEFENPDVLHYTRNSPYVAMCLAAQMGASAIGLIGVDFTDHHFFANTGRHSLAGELHQIDQEYGRLYQACVDAGIEVFNLSAESRLTSLPKLSLEEYADRVRRKRAPRIVSYSCSPVAGVPAILAKCMSATGIPATAVWESNSYGNGVCFEGGIEWSRKPEEARQAIECADLVVVHNGKVHPRHESLLKSKPVVTMAHNYLWNVDTRFVKQGFPGLVVGQYQAALPEFEGWKPVPNPVPLDASEYLPEAKPEVITICYTPSGKHESYPPGHRLYWHGKGYATTMRILDHLAGLYRLDLQVIRTGQISHAQSLAMKRRSHIVIDECVTGSYHRNSLEGLAAGCVVVNGFGLMDGVADVFARCSGSSEVPFVTSSLAELQQTLVSLVEMGAERLAGLGMENRRWMERHWKFSDQWDRFWLPAAREAMDKLRPVPLPRAPQNVEKVRGEVSVILPHGGRERLPLLELTLRRLRASGGAKEILVVEQDKQPHAQPLAESLGCRHIFQQQNGTFHKAAAVSAGCAAASHPNLLWLDSDVLIPDGFIQESVAELEDRQLDCLVPYAVMQYLNSSDSDRVRLDAGAKPPPNSAPVTTLFSRRGAAGGIVLVRADFIKQHGGIPEAFRGYGGEDTAFFHKAKLYGKAAHTIGSRVAHHLYHADSGGYDAKKAMSGNPYYSANLQLLERIRACHTVVDYERIVPRVVPEPPGELPEVIACREFCRECTSDDALALIQMRLFPLASVLMVDAGEAIHKLVRAFQPLAAVHTAGKEDLRQFPDRSFDRILFCWPDADADRIARKLKAGGISVRIGPDGKPTVSGGTPTPLGRVSMPEAPAWQAESSLLQRAGYEIVRTNADYRLQAAPETKPIPGSVLALVNLLASSGHDICGASLEGTAPALLECFSRRPQLAPSSNRSGYALLRTADPAGEMLFVRLDAPGAGEFEAATQTVSYP